MVDRCHELSVPFDKRSLSLLSRLKPTAVLHFSVSSMREAIECNYSEVLSQSLEHEDGLEHESTLAKCHEKCWFTFITKGEVPRPKLLAIERERRPVPLNRSIWHVSKLHHWQLNFLNLALE